jgi:2,5-diketo-D-gluconate reductase A
MTTGTAPMLPLAHGAEMPQLGLGTWPMTGAEARDTVVQAIQAGYRRVDTAEQYGNEAAVGEGMRASGLAREELFVTTKFNAQWHGEDLAQQACRAAAQRLGVDYIDMLLIHWPNPWLDQYVAAWRGLTKLLADGSVRAIGTSNFKPSHLDRLLEETAVAPDVNQVQLDPTLIRAETRAYHEAHGIVTEAWSPLGRGGAVLEAPVITELATRHAKSPAQVVLRWHMDLGQAAAPRSSNAIRLAENLDIFDFHLTAQEVAAISALDRGEGAARNSDAEGH